MENRSHSLVVGLLSLIGGGLILTNSNPGALLNATPVELGAISRGIVGIVLIAGTVIAADERDLLTQETLPEVLFRGNHRMEVVAGVMGISLFIAEAHRLGAPFPKEVVAIGNLLLPIVGVFFGIQMVVLTGASSEESVSTA